MTPATTRPDTADELRRAERGTWVALLIVPTGVTAALFLDRDADPVVHGLVACAAAFQGMIALWSWRSARRRRQR